MRVVGEVEIAWRLLANEVIAITGSNGKTTTTEWVGHIHREAGLPVAVAGNVGTALSTLALEPPDPAATIVCEVSSFQLEDTELFAPEGAVLLNLTPDHLDRHGTFEAYTQAKLQVFARQGNDDVAVAPQGLGIEDLGGCARRVCFGDRAGRRARSDRAGHLWWDEAGADRRRRDRPAGRPQPPERDGRGRDHARPRRRPRRGRRRPGHVRRRRPPAGGGRRRATASRYVNDSKATNVDAAVTGLTSFAGGVHVILGGRGLGGDLARARRGGARSRRRRVPDRRGRAAARRGLACTSPWWSAGDLETAVAAATKAARPGETILLSPAAKSFDQYADFEARGDHFRALARAAGAR